MEGSTKDKSSLSQKHLVLKEGYGATELHLRQNQRAVRDLLGAPKEEKPGPGARAFWIYSDLGIDVSISTKSGRVLSLFFYRQGSDGHQQANVEIDRGVHLSDTKRKVLALYGRPYKRGEPFLLSTGEPVREWFSYQSGIGFHFGPDQRVDIVSIFSPSIRKPVLASRKSARDQ
jgi:hypothetical protein